MRLLIVEDEPRLARRLADGLREEGFAVDLAPSAAAARRLAERASYDLVLLDVMLGDGSGLELLRRWRSTGLHAPVLVLTARDLVEDKLDGFRAGADDYLTKPFAFEELLARIRALLRRGAAAPRRELVVGDLRLDRDAHLSDRAGRALALSPKEFALLEYFMLHPDVVLSRDRIAAHVWDSSYMARSNTIDVIVARLRRKLEEGGASRILDSVPGVGYVLRRAGTERP
ncbi:MAG: response regulator transcription factor [Acidobacteria bacterium]|nr:response regulator transcription factor [Acidobacteriota bacterium]